ncbi:MAG: hypothetical protein KJ767_03595 [Nanoarchaeota archaeon]|nr:hypothetical protein [Nanoarchaeota archaeon]
MNKRGQIRKNIVEIILLVFFIGIILLAAVAVTNIYLNKGNSASKEHFLNLSSQIKSLNQGQVKGPIIFYVSSDNPIKSYDAGEKSPEDCFGKACLCLCKKTYGGIKLECMNDVICETFDKNLRLKEKGSVVTSVFLKGNAFYTLWISNIDDEVIVIFNYPDDVKPYLEKQEQEALQEEEKTQGEIKSFYTEFIGPGIAASTKLPAQNLINAYEKQAFKSQGTIKELVDKYSKEYGVEPYLIASIASMESTMGTSSGCKSVGKSILTGCKWPTSCASGCKCSSSDVYNDEGQVKCTANLLRNAYEQASGKESGLYSGCKKYSNDLDKWRCIFCMYNKGIVMLNCDYQSNIFSFYKQWKKYYEDKSV